jgi:dihydrofolate reductase
VTGWTDADVTRLQERLEALVGRLPGVAGREAREETAVRTLAITQNVTLDGSIEMVGDWFNPQGQADQDDSDLLEEVHRQDSGADGFLVGRRTLEELRGYWPKQSDDPTGITDYLNRVQKYVVSSTMTDPQWQNTTVLAGDPVEEVRALKQQSGQDIVVTGSITLCHTLIEAGLADEYRLFVYPVVQGRGRRLFPDGFELPVLRLLETKAFRSGIAYSRYACP